MKKVLVTGGAGFIGSHLCDALLRKGCEVLCIDNLYTGSRKNIEHLFGHQYFNFVEVDITNSRMIIALGVENNFDEIYHLACPASPKAYQQI